MTTIMVRLPEDDLAFLQRFSAAQGTSAEAVLARHVHNLCEQLQRPLANEVTRATSIISAGIADAASHLEYLEQKHA